MRPDPQATLARLGVAVPKVLLPRPDVDLFRWAVIACDQHTSRPEYWAEVDRIVGSSPSTLRVIFPEVYLGEPDRDARIAAIHSTMDRYLDSVLVEAGPGMVLTVRTTPHARRRGLILALDLDRYEYRPGTDSLIRATEQTILDRIPPRVAIRRNAPLELPHVMVLIDDPEDALFGGLDAAGLTELYSTPLMLDGGEISGYRVTGPALERVAGTLERLHQTGSRPFLFAAGDGNHSLAAAKTVWEETRPLAGPDHPSRYALVEVVNIYDKGLRFEPIHRLVKPVDDAWIDSFARTIGAEATACTAEELRRHVSGGTGSIGMSSAGRCLRVRLGGGELAVSRVQDALDSMEDLEVDYVHGWESSLELGHRPGYAAVLLPEFDPAKLFATVSDRGVLPRKAFSLGEAEEKRYYLEARRIS